MFQYHLLTVCPIFSNADALFIRQQLISLFDNGLLSFDGNEWTCDIEKVEETGTLVEDIVGVVLDKIKRLPSLTQHTLMVSKWVGAITSAYHLPFN